MPGYEVKFVNPLLKRHECPICFFTMRNPVQTECGHRFCKECLEPVLKRRHPTCPLDKEEILQKGIFLDNACRREILNLEVSCNFMSSGCSWIGHLKSLDEHLSKCECRIAGLQAPSRSQSSPQGQTSSLPAQVPQIPDSLANETLYKKREDNGTISFIPVHVGGQSASLTDNRVGNRVLVKGNCESPGGIESVSSVAIPEESNSTRGDQQHTRNQVHTPDTGGDHTHTPAQASPKEGNPNLFHRPAAKDYSKDTDSMKSDTTLKQHILNNAVAGQSSSQQLTPRSSGEQSPAKVAPPNGKSAAKVTEPSSLLEAGLNSPASGSADERERVLLILKATEKRMTVKDISESTGKEVEEVTAILMQLFQKGKVSREMDEKGNECWAIVSQASGR